VGRADATTMFFGNTISVLRTSGIVVSISVNGNVQLHMKEACLLFILLLRSYVIQYTLHQVHGTENHNMLQRRRTKFRI